MKDIEFTAELLKRQEKIFWALRDLQMEFVFNGDIDLLMLFSAQLTDLAGVAQKYCADMLSKYKQED